MDLDALINALGSPEAEARVAAARIVAMVEETRALEALKQAFTTENVPRIRKTMGWAGQKLAAALEAGYSTQEALFHYFGVYREIVSAAPTPDEAQAMAEQERRETAQIRRIQNEQPKDESSLKTGISTANMMFGNPLVSLALLSARPSPQAQPLSTDSASTLAKTGQKRAPAVQPSETDIRAWVRRLREDDDPVQRKKAAAELASLHNPAALPYLALAYAADLNPEVCQAAQQYGKILYWGVLYWQMQQDGSLRREMDRCIAERRQATGFQSSTPPAARQESVSPKPSSPEDIVAILRKAEDARKRRGRG